MKNGMNLFPAATVDDGTVSIRFADQLPSQSIDVKCIVDLTDFGDVIGVEVLDWRRQLSGGVLDAQSARGPVRWSYDDEIDAFYIHLTEGRRQIQRSTVASVGLDSNRCVVRLQVPIPSAV